MSANRSTIEFSPYRLDLEAERLWCGDEPIDLRPKTWSVLRYLAERPGQLVTRDELMDNVWRDVVVSVHSLTETVRDLRRILSDSARNPRFIETVHRRGFRFIAPVSGPDSSIQAGEETSPVLGRGAELARLDGWLTDAMAGRRRIVFITGEAGIGKTSLLQSFLRRLDRGRLAVAGGQCLELLGDAEAYLPILDALDRLARDTRGDWLRTALGRFAPTWMAQLPWLLEGETQASAQLAGSPVRMLREFCVMLEEVAAENPVVLWLEDAHWSDPSTVDLIGALARRAEPARILVLVTYRPVDAAVRDHPIASLRRSLEQHGACHSVPLELLDLDHVEEFVTDRLGAVQDPHSLARLIYEETDGNPLFLETVVKHLVSEGFVVQNAGVWRLTESIDTVRRRLPASLVEIVESQLTGMTDEEIQYLEAASVCGEAFPVQAVAAALDANLERTEAICGHLAEIGRILTRSGTTLWVDGTEGRRCQFQHQVFRKILYERATPSLRRSLHRRLALRLADVQTDPRGGTAAEIAFHFERGGEPDRAIDYLVAAAEGVRRRFADREAVSYLNQALDLLTSRPESPDRDRRECAVRLRLARALVHSVGFTAPEQVSNSDRVIELGKSLNDSEAQLIGLAYRQDNHLLGGDLDRAREQREESRRLVNDATNPILEGHVLRSEGYEAGLRGEPALAAESCARSYALLRDLEPREVSSVMDYDVGVFAVGFTGWAAWLLGRPDEARRFTDESRQRASREGTTPLGIAVAASVALGVEHFRRDREAARAVRGKLEDCLQEHGLPWPYGFIAAADGWLRVADGEVAAGIERLRTGAAEMRSAGTMQATSILYATLAEAELARGRPDAALEALDEAAAFVEKSGERFWEAEIHRLRGELLRLGGHDTAVEEWFAKSLEVARSQGARSLELRGATSLAKLWAETDRRTKGRRLLSDALKVFTQGFDTADYQDAKVVLATLSE